MSGGGLAVLDSREEWEWLRQNSSFGDLEVDGDTNYNIVTVVISKHILEKFKAKYLKQ